MGLSVFSLISVFSSCTFWQLFFWIFLYQTLFDFTYNIDTFHIETLTQCTAWLWGLKLAAVTKVWHFFSFSQTNREEFIWSQRSVEIKSKFYLRKSFWRYLGRDGRVFRRYLGRDGTVQKRTFLTYFKNYFNNVLSAHNNRYHGGHVRVIG